MDYHQHIWDIQLHFKLNNFYYLIYIHLEFCNIHHSIYHIQNSNIFHNLVLNVHIYHLIRNIHFYILRIYLLKVKKHNLSKVQRNYLQYFKMLLCNEYIYHLLIQHIHIFFHNTFLDLYLIHNHLCILYKVQVLSFHCNFQLKQYNFKQIKYNYHHIQYKLHFRIVYSFHLKENIFNLLINNHFHM